jgi:hypothetical protein
MWKIVLKIITEKNYKYLLKIILKPPKIPTKKNFYNTI